MSSIKPTIGRKVWFYDSAPAARYDNRVPFDATVVYVWNETLVNLMVVDHAGQTHVRTSVALRDPASDDSHGGAMFATWMPYQVGQAKPAT